MKKISLKRLANFAINGLTILTYILTLIGLLLAAGLKKDSISSKILPHYSRYNLAIKAIKIFEDEPQAMKRGDEPIKGANTGKIIMATVLDIDHPSWPVMLDFMKSDIAFRKSDRNEPTEENLSTSGQLSDNSNTPHKDVLPEIKLLL